MTLCQRELIDGPSIGCDHETSFAFRALAWNEPAYRGISFSANDGSHRQIEFLGRARVYADGRPGDVALRRQHALPGADCAGRHTNHFGLRHGSADAGEPGDAKLDESLRELAAGADILINDAQFTPEQLETTRKGWGHSSWLEGAKLARQVEAKTLVLFHHDPDSTDRMVDSILRQARDEFDSVFAASEGMVVTLGAPGDRVQAHMPGTRTALRREAQFHAKVCGVTEGGKDFEEETVVRDISLQGALISLKHMPQLQSELQVTMEAPGSDGLQSMKLRGYVVRIDAGTEKGRSSVGVFFTD